MNDRQKHEPIDQEEPPPIFGTWRRLYAAVLSVLAVLIIAFYFFGRSFR